MSRVLCVRLDSVGDVLLAGPAVRAVASCAREVVMLAGPVGEEAAALLPGVDDVLVWSCPWIAPDPAPVQPFDIEELVALLRGRRFDRALVFTSFHQSALPTALLLRMAGIPSVSAICEDYPGSLLDLRHRPPDELPEAERALSLAGAAGYDLPEGDDGRLRVRGPLPDVRHLVGIRPYIVLHPGTSVPARAWPADHFAETARELGAEGHHIVVTGTPSERHLTAWVAAQAGADLGGRTDLADMAAVLAGAQAVVVGNTGPAHLAAAVNTPVVSLFAPTVPRVRWAPYRVPHVLLGDQQAPCRDTRARHCSVPGHPCLADVAPHDVVRALRQLTGRPSGTAGHPVHTTSEEVAS